MKKKIRPCHSIHCRHYDLADGMMCEVEAARILDNMTRTMKKIADSPISINRAVYMRGIARTALRK